MQGYWQVIYSFSVGIITLGTLTQLTNIIKSKERFTPLSEPTILQGRSEDDNLSLSWGLKAIRAQEAWRISQGSKDIIVAVIDTGCDVHHPDFSG